VTARLGLALLACACACASSRAPLHPETPPGHWYVLGPGEKLEDIARQAGVPVEDILELNGLAGVPPAEVRPPKLIFVLEAPRIEPAPPRPGTGPALRWPLDGDGLVVASPFGARGGRPHEGIDLPAPIGTPVRAAADGRVVYAGDGIRGYGNLVVVRHSGDLLTVYAHNSALLVREGDAVAAGDRVALVGQSGHATGPHLHFEVRQEQIPRDPMLYLPTLSGGKPR
jgi:murein DD-endopeptidase MepM/ murein hydrolase activator NlpD